MMKYRLYLSVLLAVFAAAFSDISAQYRIVGFEGMDTVDLGIAEQRGGKFVLPKNIAKYTKIELIPVSISQTYSDIENHFLRLQKVYMGKLTEETVTSEIAYIKDKLDFNLLYYSPIYPEYLWGWLGAYVYLTKSTVELQQRFAADAIGTIARLMMQDNGKIAQKVAKDLALFTNAYKYFSATREIIDYMQKTDKDFINKHKDLKYVIDRDLVNTPKQAAHKIVGLDSERLANCLIIFFDSGSRRSTDEVDKIIDKYGSLQQKGLRVISIASDTDLEQYNEFAKRLPWADKLCDQYGINGENFVNYGVFGTPAIFLTDKEGNIIRAGSDLDKVIQ